MPEFEIAFTDDQFEDEGTLYRQLRLTLGDFSEEMDADMTVWPAEEYEKQWIFELSQIATTRHQGALITSIHDPQNGYRVSIWPMWRQNGFVLFHSKILFMLEANPNFDPAHVSDYVGEYASHGVDGHRISEWSVPLIAISTFINKRRMP